MNSAALLDRIDEHQAGVATLAGAMLAAAHAGPAAGAARFAEVRARLVRALRRYQVFKHREVFNPAIAAGSAAQADAARGMKASCIASGEQCRHFFRTWSARDLTSSWDGYVAAAHELVAGMRAHLAAERRAIAGALAAAGR